jgi:DNA-binding NarL/FixJ family response regulator
MIQDEEDILTPMQRHLIECVQLEKTNVQIGHELKVRPDTISHRLTELYRIAGCCTRGGLIDKAYKKGWLKV